MNIKYFMMRNEVITEAGRYNVQQKNAVSATVLSDSIIASLIAPVRTTELIRLIQHLFSFSFFLV